MLTIKILTNSKGNPNDTQEVGVLTIVNNGGSETLADYRIELNGKYVGDVKRYERKRFGVWYLVEKAVDVALREGGVGRFRRRMPVVEAVQWFPEIMVEGVTLHMDCEKPYGTYIRNGGSGRGDETMEVYPGDFIVGGGMGRITVPGTMFNEVYERIRA